MNRERKLPVRSQSISVESERGASHFRLPEGLNLHSPDDAVISATLAPIQI